MQRSAEVHVPSDGAKELFMPLSWLCSEANLEAPCPEGETCRAGRCADRRVGDPSTLPDYTDRESTSCFDTARCLRHSVRETPQILSAGIARGRCALRDNAVSLTSGANVALIVDNAGVGNYGFCGPAGSCFTPLARDTDGGWSSVIEGGVSVAIALPDVVCENIGTTIRSVAVAPLDNNGSCQIKSEEQPLCAPEEATCLEASICPSDWPDERLGYSCAATQSPEIEDPLSYCWPTGTEPEAESVPGLWCCLTGQDPPEDRDPLLIDDMSLGPVVQVAPPEGRVPGGWFTYINDRTSAIYPRPDELFTCREFDPPVTPEGGPEIRHAACVRSDGFTGNSAGMGFPFAVDLLTQLAVPFDVSQYTGIRFWLYSELDLSSESPTRVQQINVLFTDGNTDSWYRDSACRDPDPVDCGDAFGKRGVIASHQWEQVFVAWEELQQSSNEWGAQFDGLDQERVISVVFEVAGAGPNITVPPFDICVAQIYFTTD